jgi:FlaG/FlaF family flagellin (archaellin)
MPGSFFKGAFVGGIGAALVLAATAAFAGTARSFFLGQANSAGAPSSLSAPVADAALKVTNTSNASGSTALALNVANGKPPLSVNSSTKVANLNADKLDGLRSTAFAQPTRVTRSVSCAGSGFNPMSSTYVYKTIGGERSVLSGPTTTLQCPISLPDRALITAVSFAVSDEDANGVISEVLLNQTPLILQNGILQGSVNATIAVKVFPLGIDPSGTPGERTVTFPPREFNVVDNAKYTYWLGIQFQTEQKPSFSHTLAIVGASVTYALIEPPTSTPSCGAACG